MRRNLDGIYEPYGPRYFSLVAAKNKVRFSTPRNVAFVEWIIWRDGGPSYYAAIHPGRRTAWFVRS